jgi:DNA-binding MarR family transcriptional regulator
MTPAKTSEKATDDTGNADPDPRSAEIDDVSEVLLASVSLLVRKMRQVHDTSGLTLSERSALSRLDRDGPTTSAGLARHEQISPQSMGATLRGLEERGLVDRRADPRDGRRVVLSVTPGGKRHLKDKRNAKSKQLARILSSGFTTAEIAQLKAASALIERVGQSL